MGNGISTPWYPGETSRSFVQSGLTTIGGKDKIDLNCSVEHPCLLNNHLIKYGSDV